MPFRINESSPAHRRQTPEKSGVLYLMNIGLSQQTRFKHLDDLSDLENAISKHFTSPQVTATQANQYVSQILVLLSKIALSTLATCPISSIPSQINNRQFSPQVISIYISYLDISQHTRFEHPSELSDLENAISNQRKGVQLADDGHPWKGIHLLEPKQSFPMSR
jgi:hypothetical protein